VVVYLRTGNQDESLESSGRFLSKSQRMGSDLVIDFNDAS